MNRFTVLREQWLEFMYICRAIFHAGVRNGISLSFFRNSILEIKR
ncbi:RAxF-45 family protein [Priestia koreensis]|nr:RAxF-45 family protein [Priestia koreensis]